MDHLPITFRGAVYPWHLDHMGHMNVMHYVHMFDQSTWALLAALGMPTSYFREERRAMAAVEQNIEYREELFPGDLVENRSGVIEVRAKAVRFRHVMSNVQTGTVAAQVTMVAVHIDSDARRGAPLPAGVRDRAAALMWGPEVSKASHPSG